SQPKASRSALVKSPSRNKALSPFHASLIHPVKASNFSLIQSSAPVTASTRPCQIFWPDSVLAKKYPRAPATNVSAPTQGIINRLAFIKIPPTLDRTGITFQHALKTVPTTPPSLARIGLADLALPMRLSSPCPIEAPLNAPETPLTALPSVPSVEAAEPIGPEIAPTALYPRNAMTIFSTTPGLFSANSATFSTSGTSTDSTNGAIASSVLAKIGHVATDTFCVTIKNDPTSNSIDGHKTATVSLIVVKISPNYSHVSGFSALSVMAKTISPILPTASPAIGATRVSIMPAKFSKAGVRVLPNSSDTGLTASDISSNTVMMPPKRDGAAENAGASNDSPKRPIAEPTFCNVPIVVPPSSSATVPAAWVIASSNSANPISPAEAILKTSSVVTPSWSAKAW